HDPDGLAAVSAAGGLRAAGVSSPPRHQLGAAVCRARKGEGRLHYDALRDAALTGKTETAMRRPEGPGPAVVSGCPGLDSAKRSSLSDLAAGHLQGPARTVTKRYDHLLSLVWP